jgi:hypothetical protein
MAWREYYKGGWLSKTMFCGSAEGKHVLIADTGCQTTELAAGLD